MRRTRLLLAIGFIAFVFLGVSALLARALSDTGSERAAVLALVRAQARGDAPAVLARLPRCAREPACEEAARDVVRGLKRPGRVEILQYRPSTQIALTRQIGTGRVAWRAGAGLPVVQCVRVQREGPLTGGRAELLSISAPIDPQGSCPG